MTATAPSAPAPVFSADDTLRRHGRAPVTNFEAAGLVIVALAILGFGFYGWRTHAPSTVAYLTIVTAVSVVLVAVRRVPLPGSLVGGLAVLAVAHLAGGLVRIGQDVLYNASAGSPVLRYDHFVHSAGSFLAVLVCVRLFGSRETPTPRAALPMWLLAGLGLGALNEMIEFLTTVLHHGSHVGGYVNTGWDLVSNFGGSLVACAVVARSSRRPAGLLNAQ
jgi:hypothetical protein